MSDAILIEAYECPICKNKSEDLTEIEACFSKCHNKQAINIFKKIETKAIDKFSAFKGSAFQAVRHLHRVHRQLYPSVSLKRVKLAGLLLVNREVDGVKKVLSPANVDTLAFAHATLHLIFDSNPFGIPVSVQTNFVEDHKISSSWRILPYAVSGESNEGFDVEKTAELHLSGWVPNPDTPVLFEKDGEWLLEVKLKLALNSWPRVRDSLIRVINAEAVYVKNATGAARLKYLKELNAHPAYNSFKEEDSILSNQLIELEAQIRQLKQKRLDLLKSTYDTLHVDELRMSNALSEMPLSCRGRLVNGVSFSTVKARIAITDLAHGEDLVMGKFL